MDYKYTIPRGPIAAQFGSPGPCYGLPGLTGKQRHDPRSVHYCNPAYPFGVRHGKMRDECGPGPAYFPNPRYSNKGPDGTPQYSLYGRKDADLKTTTPGPAAYSTQNIPPPDHPRQPAYTFGTRRRSRRTDDTPGPNRYEADPMTGKTVRSGKRTGPSHSLKGRTQVGAFHEDLAKTPGPGHYGTTEPQTYKEKSPQYSITGKNQPPGDSTQKPGPGAYKPESVTCDKKNAPKFWFGIRHSQYSVPMIVDVDD